MRKRKMEQLNLILGKQNSAASATAKATEAERREINADSQEDEFHYKDLFKVSQKKNEFFEAAKTMMTSNMLP